MNGRSIKTHHCFVGLEKVDKIPKIKALTIIIFHDEQTIGPNLR